MHEDLQGGQLHPSPQPGGSPKSSTPCIPMCSHPQGTKQFENMAMIIAQIPQVCGDAGQGLVGNIKDLEDTGS